MIKYFALFLFILQISNIYTQDVEKGSSGEETIMKSTFTSMSLVNMKKLFAEPLFEKLLEEKVKFLVKREIESKYQNCSCKFSKPQHHHTNQSFMGPPGARGPPGPRGPKGQKGDRGPIGFGLHAPRVKESILVKEANLSSSVNMTCRFFGNPIPKVSWEFSFHDAIVKNKVDNKTSEITSTLFIRNITWEDRGDVKCMASTILGKAEESGKLIVHRKPSIHKMPLTVYATVGVPFSFPRCKAVAYPKAVITWKRVFLSLGNTKSINTNGTLILKSVSDFDEGFYQCTAVNYLGGETKTIQLKAKPLSFLPDKNEFPVLPPDGEVTLWCAANGNGNKMSGEWYKGLTNTQIHSTKTRTARLFNMSANVKDTGVFRCEIRQEEQTVSKEIFVRKFSFGSNLLTHDNQKKLYKWIHEKKGSPVQEFKQCLYIKGTESGLDNVNTYKSKCNTSSNIIQLVMDTNGNVCGGYKDIFYRNDFLFDFNMRQYNLKDNVNQNCRKYGHSVGPCFGKDFYTEDCSSYSYRYGSRRCEHKYKYVSQLGNRFRGSGSFGGSGWIFSMEFLQGI